MASSSLKIKSPLLLFLSLLAMIWIGVEGIDTCKHEHVLSLYQKSCKYKRSHEPNKNSAASSVVKNGKKSYASEARAAAVPTYVVEELEDAEVLEILSNGLELVDEYSHSSSAQSQRKKGLEPLSLSRWRRTPSNDLPRELNEIDPEASDSMVSHGFGFDFKLKLWKSMMAQAVRVGGKVRREVYALVYKCCSQGGCTEKDFHRFC